MLGIVYLVLHNDVLSLASGMDAIGLRLYLVHSEYVPQVGFYRI